MKSILFLISFFCLIPVYCQTNNINNDFRISGGLGFYKSGYFDGISLYSSLNWSRIKLIDTINGTRYKNTNLKFRFIYNTASNGEDNFENLKEFGLLYEKSYGKIIQLTIAGGLGLFSSYKDIGSNNPHIPDKVDNSLTLGIPLEVGIITGSHFGLGIGWYADLNSKSTISGFMIRLLL